MSLIYDLRNARPGILRALRDYAGEMRHFLRRVGNPLLWLPLLTLKSIEWSIYRWYHTPVRRFYGVKGNELIYMITNACNDRCPKCAIWERPEPRSQRLDVAHFLRCLERLHHNLYQVTLTGGEPLLFKRDVVKIADEAYRLPPRSPCRAAASSRTGPGARSARGTSGRLPRRRPSDACPSRAIARSPSPGGFARRTGRGPRERTRLAFPRQG